MRQLQWRFFFRAANKRLNIAINKGVGIDDWNCDKFSITYIYNFPYKVTLKE